MPTGAAARKGSIRGPVVPKPSPKPHHSPATSRGSRSTMSNSSPRSPGHGGGSMTARPPPAGARTRALSHDSSSGKPPRPARINVADSDSDDMDDDGDDADDEPMIYDDDSDQGDELLDPSLLWFASRGTQCRTPDVPSASQQASGVDAAFGSSHMGDMPAEVFSIPVADYNAKASQNVEDDDDSDDDRRKGRMTYHSPPRGSVVMIRVAGNRYGFSSDTRLRPEPYVPMQGRKPIEKSTQTTDRRIMEPTRFVDTAAAAAAVEPEKPPQSTKAGARKPPVAGNASAKAPLMKPPRPDRRRSSTKGSSMKGEGPKARNASGALSSPLKASPSTPSAPSGDGDAPAEKSGGQPPDADTPVEDAEGLPPIAAAGRQTSSPRQSTPAQNTRTTPATLGKLGATRKPPSRGRVGQRGPVRRTVSNTAGAPHQQNVKDPADDFEWIDGIGNVPRRHQFYEQMRQVKPRVRPSSAEVSAALNQDDGDSPADLNGTAAAQPTATDGDATAFGEEGNPLMRGPGNDGDVDSSGTGQSGVYRRDSTALSMSTASMGGLDSPPDVVPPTPPDVVVRAPAALQQQPSAAAAFMQPTNPYAVEERRLPDVGDRRVRRSVLPIDDANFHADGSPRTERAAVHNVNPWAGAKFSYDPRRFMSTGVAATHGKSSGSQPQPAKSSDVPLPLLHQPDEPMDSPASGPSSKAGAASKTGVGAANASSSKPAQASAAATAPASGEKAGDAQQDTKDAKAETVKTAKQQLLDREREFARMFPDWLANDDRLRPVTKAARGSRR